MTRLLAPEIFGVMAIAIIVMVGLAMFSDIGLRPIVVQSRRGSEPAFLNTAWSLQVLRGLLLWVMALIAALALGLGYSAGVTPSDSVYANPSLPWVIAVVSFSAIISGFTSTKVLEASRKLVLGRLIQIELVAQFIGFGAMLMWAALDRSVWALVAGWLVSGMISVAAGHAFLPGTPNRLLWDKGAQHELLRFGKWVLASSILGFVAANSDRLLLGTMVDADTFGVCVIAFLIVGTIDQLLGRLTAGVALAALSEVARSGGDLRAAYYRLHTVIAGAAYLISGFLMSAGPPLISILYDERYAAAGWMLQTLSVALLVSPFQISLQVYLALGKPEVHSRILAIRLMVLFIAMPISFHQFGLLGALWSVVLSQLASAPLFVFYNVKNGIFDSQREMIIIPATALGALAGILSLLIA